MASHTVEFSTPGCSRAFVESGTRSLRLSAGTGGNVWPFERTQCHNLWHLEAESSGDWKA